MAPKLATYRAKRDPNKTPEPMGATEKRRRAAAAPRFVIQEHHARALHWDFRLERNGVLVSWALPKGLPVDPTRNHLAVQTEDHPLEYEGFEGDIPKGEYGGGHVSIWDHGTYDLEKWSDHEIKVVLHGEHARGRYVLFPTKGKNWMIHRMDPPPDGFEPMPEHIAPMLAQTGEIPTSEREWAYEFKWDGIRAMVYVDGGRVRVLSRTDKDLTPSFPELRELGPFFGARSAIVDGEIVAFDSDGRPDFGKVQHRLHPGASSGGRHRTVVEANFLAFDLLYFDGHSLVHLPYDDRRKLLEMLDLNGPRFATPPSARGRAGADILSLARQRGLEGVVAKRRDASYAPGRRTGTWIKVKTFRTQEVVIGGWTDGNGERKESLGALLLGVPSANGLEYVGKVGTGFTATTRRQLIAAMQPLARKTSPFSGGLTSTQSRLAHFVRPKIVGEVRFSQWTDDGHLRHPAWRGTRPDKRPSEVVYER